LLYAREEWKSGVGCSYDVLVLYTLVLLHCDIPAVDLHQ
jgi:hypothetical protein